MDATQVQRTRRWREKDKENGIVTVEARVPKEKRAELLALCKQWRDSQQKHTIT